jgi:hypothetical protein
MFLLPISKHWRFLSVNGLRYISNSVIPYFSVFKDLVFLASKKIMYTMQALWQVLVLALTCATCQCA